MPRTRPSRFRAVPYVGILAVALPVAALGQDSNGGAALTPVAWVLIALLSACSTVLIVLVATLPKIRDSVQRALARSKHDEP
jgi:hypothetical protein